MAERVPIKVPDIGDFHDVEVIEILVKPGEAVKKEQSLITLESDKASMEIPSPMAGVVREMRVKLGDKVSEGSLILEMEPARRQQSGSGAVPGSCSGTAGGAPRVRRRGRGMRGPGARLLAWRVFGRVPGRRPGSAGCAGRALSHARRRVLERRLHSIQGAAARGVRDR